MNFERILERALRPILAHIADLETQVPPSVKRVLVQIRLNLVEPGFTVAELQRNLGSSGNNWRLAEFKAAVGLAVWAFIQQARLAAAAWMLGYTTVRVEDVVTLVGYEDTSSFTRLFKSWTGLTPGEFRAWARKTRRQGCPIPEEIFNWFYSYRCARFTELPREHIRGLVVLLEKRYGPVPGIPKRPPGHKPPADLFPDE